MIRKSGLGIMVLAAGLATLESPASSEPYAFTGARASGMGGANAASTRDASAIWHNPAAFGFMGETQWTSNAVDNGGLSQQRFNWEIMGIGGGYTMTEDLGRYLNILADVDLSNLESGTLSDDGENVESLLSVAGIVGKLNSGDALYADVNAGTAFQIGNFGLGLRVFGEGIAYALPDRDNLSLVSYADTEDLVDEINQTASNEGFDGTGYTFQILSSDQRDDLSSTLGGTADADEAVKYLDAKLKVLADAGDFTGEEVSSVIDTMAALRPESDGSIESNQTAVVGRGFAVTEIPVSYGWAVNENLSIGATAKAMFGNVLGTQIWIFDENNDQVLEDLSDNYETSVNVGLDLGALYRMNNFQFALVGHNLNRPTFDGFTETVTVNGIDRTLKVPDVKIDPQVVLGAAWMPSRRLTLEASCDLLETGTLLPDYDIQRISFGGEVDLRLLALRLGTYKNMAASWQGWVATAGVGVNLAGVRLDLAGAVSLDNNVEYDGQTIPSEARLYAGIGLDF